MNLPGFLTRNTRLKAVASGLAIISWAAVVYAANPPESRTVTVKVPQDSQSLPAKYTLVRPIADLAIRVQGTREHVNAFDPSSLTVSVDFHSIQHPGLQSLPVSIVNRDSNVDLDNPPATVDADVDLLDTASVQVTIVHKVNPPAGYSVAAESASPDHVTVIGPQRELRSVQAVVEVDLGNRKTNLTRELNVTIRDNTGHTVGDVGVQQPTVTVTITIKPEATMRTSAVLPKFTGTAAGGFFVDGISANPGLVVLNGPQDILNSLDSVPTEPISVSGVTTDRFVTVHLQLPAGVTATPDTVTVHISIGALPTPIPLPTPCVTPQPTPPLTPPATPAPKPC